MRRLQTRVPRVVHISRIRTFSCSSLPLQRKATSNLDPTGRTPGFARRARPTPQRQQHSSSPSSSQPPQQPSDKVANALQASSSNDTNNLLAPVHIPEDRHGILRSDHPATSILANSSIVVQRQLEMMNVFLGFEQANKYVMMDSSGNQIGYLAEQEHGVANAVARQTFRTHRSFTTHVFDKNEQEVLRFHRPFSWISSRIKVYDASQPGETATSSTDTLQGTSPGSVTNQTSAQISPLDTKDLRVVGEAQQQWAPLRRKYNLFLNRPLTEEPAAADAPRLSSGDLPLSKSTAIQTVSHDDQSHGFAQFASVDEPFLSWDFSLMAEDGKLLGSVNRNFAGFAREIFTDTGVYALRMDSAGLAAEPQHLISQTATQAQQSEIAAQSHQQTQSVGMTLDQRAVMLATAVSIDFDYFSRHSGHGAGGGFMPIWFPWGGGAGAGEAAGGAEAGGAAEAGGIAGASEEGAAARGASETARGYGAGEGGMAGAGSLAGYEAMQRGRGSQGADDASPQAPPQDDFPQDYGHSGQQGGDDDFWGGFGGGGKGGGGSSGGDAGGDGGGGDGGSFFDDLF